MSEYKSIEQMVADAENRHIRVCDVMLREQSKDSGVPQDQVFAEMEERVRIMERSVVNGLKPGVRSRSGLTGGDAYRLAQYGAAHDTLLGGAFSRLIARALAVSEYNASMGKIVACPTAGSAGVMPACLVTLIEDEGVSYQDAVMSTFTAAGFGLIIARNACVAGAVGGCQAEIGSAAAMAAGAIVEAKGGTPRMASHACAIAIKSVLGLVCDPVAGLVEIPCIKRNAMGAVVAFMAAQEALAGIESKIPVDETIDAMNRVGRRLPESLRETGTGGLAATPTGVFLRTKAFGERR